MMENVAKEISPEKTYLKDGVIIEKTLEDVNTIEDAISPKNNPSYRVGIINKFGDKKPIDNLNPKMRKKDGANPVNKGQGEF